MSTDVIEAGGQLAEQREPLSVAEMRAAMTRMTEYRDSLMQQKVHYGAVPGCGKKPTLLKPGAEILIAGFNAVPRLKVDEVEEGNGHKTFTVTATLHDRHAGIVVGEGVGSCSTLESKYRYRNDNTGKEVPRNYWDTKNPALIGGDAYVAKKLKGKWMICMQVEYKDPADYWNTCLKMAKKRALVDAALTMAAASELFTQDLEDMPRPATNETTTTATAAPPTRAGQQQAAPGGTINEKQSKTIFAIAHNSNKGLGGDDFKESCRAVQKIVKETMGCTVKAMPADRYDDFIEYLRGLVSETKTTTVPPPAGIRPVKTGTISDDEVPPQFR
jgi:hypothetical protein